MDPRKAPDASMEERLKKAKKRQLTEVSTLTYAVRLFFVPPRAALVA